MYRILIESLMKERLIRNHNKNLHKIKDKDWKNLGLRFYQHYNNRIYSSEDYLQIYVNNKYTAQLTKEEDS